MAGKKQKTYKALPAGIATLSYIYLYLSIFTTLSLFFPYKYIVVLSFGLLLPEGAAIALRILLLLVPLYLFFGFKDLKKPAWTAAVFYHTFFIVNSCLNVGSGLFRDFPVDPILQTIIRPGFALPLHGPGSLNLMKIFVNSINILIGFVIIHYLSKKKDIFA